MEELAISQVAKYVSLPEFLRVRISYQSILEVLRETFLLSARPIYTGDTYHHCIM